MNGVSRHWTATHSQGYHEPNRWVNHMTGTDRLIQVLHQRTLYDQIADADIWNARPFAQWSPTWWAPPYPPPGGDGPDHHAYHLQQVAMALRGLGWFESAPRFCRCGQLQDGNHRWRAAKCLARLSPPVLIHIPVAMLELATECWDCLSRTAAPSD